MGAHNVRPPRRTGAVTAPGRNAMTSTPVDTWTGPYGTAVGDTAEHEDAAPDGRGGGLWVPRPRGRHRRPRPRKVLFAAGGLALAAGVLSLVRLSPDPGGAGGPGTAEAG